MQAKNMNQKDYNKFFDLNNVYLIILHLSF